MYGCIFYWLQTIWVCAGCVERCKALGCDAASTRSSSAEMCENSVQGESCYQSPSHEERHQGNRWESPVLQYEVYHQQANHWSQEWAISQTAPGKFYFLVLKIGCWISIIKECIPFLARSLVLKQYIQYIGVFPFCHWGDNFPFYLNAANSSRNTCPRGSWGHRVGRATNTPFGETN